MLIFLAVVGALVLALFLFAFVVDRKSSIRGGDHVPYQPMSRRAVRLSLNPKMRQELSSFTSTENRKFWE